MNKKLYIIVALISGILVVAISILLKALNLIDANLLTEIVSAKIFTLTTFIVSIIGYSYGLRQKDHIFMVIVMGGMLLRMLITLLFIIFSLKFLNFNQKNYIITILLFYFYFLILEIIYLIKQTEKIKI